ncbi:MJ1255/VC2487 family glycosyltransferase [Chondromyces apiculatus]|uniref:Glycosyltransferase n=1 Tax=Chondromyces apiculatus DSM 436 TaxID=1192034 RepID=A0A017T7T0_9BACT|nr:MJ1255/VC2487 family glycosyltransferase [Chondromyces apiculatus]EYF05328.1 Glycosyltransferase [Chondromyces apiculatus DSM 436]
MKILYGVVGEGMGHAMRSRVVLEHLLDEGHEIEVMASGRATEFLAKRFEGVNRIHGLHMIYTENRVRRGKTLWSNVLAGTTGVPENIAAYFELIKDFKPEMVISDFESWTYLYAKAHRLPIVSIDNMQIINRCAHEPEIYAGHEADFKITKAFVKSKLPFCDHYLVTTFFYPPVRKERTTLVPPILRPEVLAANRRPGEHLLVYQTAEGYGALLDTLEKTGIECRIYGMRRGITEPQVEGNLRYMPFSEEGFVDDLASCRAVIAGGGFTLMGEAVYLRKPMLAVPLGRQFEQMINARYLEREGYGQYAEALDDPAVIARFVAAIPGCEEKLAGYAQDGNKALFSQLDGLLDRAAGGVL